MIEIPHKEMIEVGLAEKREGDDLVYFEKCIGSSSRNSWSHNRGFNLTPMQVAILDTMFDAGRGTTFKKERLLNRRTRLAYYASQMLTNSRRNVRSWFSCGHDEVAHVSEWSLRKVTSFTSRYEYETEVVEVTRDKKKHDEWIEAWQQTTMDAYGVGYNDAERMICYCNSTNGNCAWEDKRNEDGVRCYHHGHHPSESVLGY